MSIHGIGTDLLSVTRIEQSYARHGLRFAKKILSAAELRSWRASREPVRALAMAFASKEAFVKALGTGFRGVSHTDVGTARDELGKPVFAYSRKLRALLKARGIGVAHLSLSDDGGMVCAMVVLERAER